MPDTIPSPNPGDGASDAASASKGSTVDAKDVTRLEDRIASSEERSQLRMDIALGRIDATVNRITDQISQLRADFVDMRSDLSQFRTEVKSDIESVRSATRTWGQWIIATILIVAFSIMALAVGLKQVWIGGVQTGQAMQAADLRPGPTNTPPQR